MHTEPPVSPTGEDWFRSPHSPRNIKGHSMFAERYLRARFEEGRREGMREGREEGRRERDRVWMDWLQSNRHVLQGTTRPPVPLEDGG